MSAMRFADHIHKVMKFAVETKSHIKDWSVDLGHGSRAGTKVALTIIINFFIIIFA